MFEVGLYEWRVIGISSNSVSLWSYGFFCVEVKKCIWVSCKYGDFFWGGSIFIIVDFVGSERVRDVKIVGVILVEVGKINESLMYLG